MVFEWIIIAILSYEILALRTETDKIPTITTILKSLPLAVSALIIALLVAVLVDHIYFQWVVP